MDQDGLTTQHTGTNTDTHLTIRNTKVDDIPRIIRLQKESFPYLAKYGNVWHTEELESHIRIFPQGQFIAAEPDGTVVGSALNILGVRSQQMVCLRIIILMETAFTVLIYQLILNTGMKGLGLCYTEQERN